jgi:hypothetical protein
MSPNAGGGGLRGLSQNEYSCAHGAQINLGRSNSIFNLYGSSSLDPCLCPGIGWLGVGLRPDVSWAPSRAPDTLFRRARRCAPPRPSACDRSRDLCANSFPGSSPAGGLESILYPSPGRKCRQCRARKLLTVVC